MSTTLDFPKIKATLLAPHDSNPSTVKMWTGLACFRALEEVYDKTTMREYDLHGEMLKSYENNIKSIMEITAGTDLICPNLRNNEKLFFYSDQKCSEDKLYTGEVLYNKGKEIRRDVQIYLSIFIDRY